MNLASVIGTATATLKHPSLSGWRMVVVQPLLADRNPDGEPLIAVDSFGAPVGSDVMITGDGKAVSEALGSKQTPVRWMVLGQPDPPHNTARQARRKGR